MAKITQEQLISQVKLLKEIKPRKEWAVLLKSEILAGDQETVKIPAQKVGVWDLIGNLNFGFGASRKLAYSFAAFLFVIFGAFGFVEYTMPGDLLFPVKKIAEQSQAALTGQSGLEQGVTILHNRINDLALVAKEGRKNNISSAINEVKENASYLAKNLGSGSVKNQQTLKEIAVSLKTLANVPGTDLAENPEVVNLYQRVVVNQIVDLEKSTLTNEQKQILEEVKQLYADGQYIDALEKILLINK